MYEFEYKPDFEDLMDRFEAWWDCQVLGRPPLGIALAKPAEERVPVPESRHATLRERWMDTGFLVERSVASIKNTVFLGESFPKVMPNLGPEVFSAFYGCPLEFGERTSWSAPILHDWSAESVNALELDTDNAYFQKIMEMTDALIEAGRGKFVVAYTDLHGGGDALAAFRDPENLLFDTLEYPEEIKALCDRITGEFLAVYDMFHNKLAAANMPSTTWLAATCRGKFHVPSNDFSCMISDDAFEDLFIPGIIRECRHMDRCIYHLDGPQALRYLDRLLDIPEIHAIQWVPGAGNEYWGDWIEVYQRIQARNKAFVTGHIPIDELPLLTEALAPEGVWIGGVGGIGTQEEAETVFKRLSTWTRKGQRI
jgi:hypothetical protein